MKRKTKRQSPVWRRNQEQACRAAEMVMEGYCAAQIAQEIFKSKNAKAINHVKPLLQLAEQSGFLCLTGREDHKLAADLRDWSGNPDLTCHVVKNDHLAYSGDPAVDEARRADAVARKAAEIVAGRIAALLLKYKNGKRRIVIANAGGVAASRIVHFLGAHRLLPDETDPRQLLFISLNSASMPTDYGRSANVLAVRMAEIYGGEHIAVCPVCPARQRQIYDHAVHHIDLLVCGAGSDRGILFTWLRQHAGITLPPEAVGDICLIPISKSGHEVPLDADTREKADRLLNLKPTYSDLHALAGRNGIIFVPMGFRSPDPQADAVSSPEHSKLAVTRAILKHSLTRTCILGATLARDLLATPAQADSSA